MSFKWSVKSEEEANSLMEEPSYSKGRYKFKVYAQEEKISANGNNYISLKMKVFLTDGFVYADDNIVDTPKMFFKRKHFWESVGFPDKLNSSSSEYVNQEGEADFDVQEYFSEKYNKIKKKLIVIDYVAKIYNEEKEEIIIEDDDIPF